MRIAQEAENLQDNNLILQVTWISSPVLALPWSCKQYTLLKTVASRRSDRHPPALRPTEMCQIIDLETGMWPAYLDTFWCKKLSTRLCVVDHVDIVEYTRLDDPHAIRSALQIRLVS